jgi:hypothetical protein
MCAAGNGAIGLMPLMPEQLIGRFEDFLIC